MRINYGILLFTFLVCGCAYYSKTDVHIQAKEARYPMGITYIGLKEGTIDVHREMQTKGLRCEPTINSVE